MASFFARVSVDLAVDDLDDDGLRAVLGELRRLQRSVDGAITELGLRADERAAAGLGAPASDLLLGSGEVRAHTARQEARRAKALASAPELKQVLTDGEIGGDQLDAFAVRTGALNDEEMASLDVEAIATDARRLPADTFDAALRRRVDRLRRDLRHADEQAQRAASEFSHWRDRRSGMGRFSGTLDPVRYEALVAAIDRHMTAMANDLPEPTAKDRNLAAAALCELVAGPRGGGLGADGAPGCSEAGGSAPTPVAHLAVVVDAATLLGGEHDDTLCETDDGHPISVAAIRRMACDATVRKVVLGEDGPPLSVGRRYRTATAAQWDAVRSIHSGCAWHGCDRPLRWTQLHHLREWRHGGRTDLDNLVPLCNDHHHRVHEGRWRIDMGPDRSLTLIRPDGTVFAEVPTPTRGSP